MVFLSWPSHRKDQNIMRDMTFLELIPVVFEIEIWGRVLKNKKGLFHVDNLSLVTIINKQSCKSKRVMELIRHFCVQTHVA